VKEEINQYYNAIAKDYDASRFSNSYGKYINSQENRILKKHITQESIESNLDIACGTGRFLNYTGYGLDISSEMVKIAKDRFPTKNIVLGDAEKLPYDNECFENIISFHLFMHLNMDVMEKIFSETSRVLKKDGLFIFDVPSLKRRKITGYNWSIACFYGVAFFPIHRIPKKIRKFFIAIDNFLCSSFLKEYSSHLIFVLRKK